MTYKFFPITPMLIFLIKDDPLPTEERPKSVTAAMLLDVAGIKS